MRFTFYPCCCPIKIETILINPNIATIQTSSELADKIYHEARILERYDDSRKISETLKYVHQRYDLLRTLLWINTAEIKEKCKGTIWKISHPRLLKITIRI